MRILNALWASEFAGLRWLRQAFLRCFCRPQAAPVPSGLDVEWGHTRVDRTHTSPAETDLAAGHIDVNNVWSSTLVTCRIASSDRVRSKKAAAWKVERDWIRVLV